MHFNTRLLSTYYLPGIPLRTGSIGIDKTEQGASLHEVYSRVGNRDIEQVILV